MQVRPPRREDNPAEGNGNPLQYSCLENPMDRAAWQGYSPRCRRVRHDWSDLARKRRNTHESVLTGGGEPRAYYTERSKISRKTNTLMHIYKWNSGRWYWQRSCGGAGAEPGFTDTGRGTRGQEEPTGHRWNICSSRCRIIRWLQKFQFCIVELCHLISQHILK